MLSIKRVDSKHFLKMDTQTDKTHLVPIGSQNSLISFCKDLICRNAAGERIARIKLIGNQWVLENDLNIQTEPVDFSSDALYSLEADFCKKWLSLQ